MLNKYRLVAYESLPCATRFECLRCKGRFVSSEIVFSFCPICGTKWEGRLEWNWVGKTLRQLHLIRTARVVSPLWVIEVRETVGEVWTVCRRQFPATGLDVYRELAKFRTPSEKSSWVNTKFRARVMPRLIEKRLP